MVYGITVRLAGMKALVVTTRCYTEIFVKHGFLQNGKHNSYQTYWYDSSTCKQPTAEKLQLYCKLSALTNSSLQHGKTGLVPRTHDMDWECKKRKYEDKQQTSFLWPVY